MDDNEVPLSGGNVNSSVVRIGETVRRGLTRSSTTVHRLLVHLEHSGFSRCPRFLGLDDKNREILTFIAGETGVKPFLWESNVPLVETAKMLRQYHDATVGFDPPEPVWGFQHPDENTHEVICHNDFAPYNFIFNGDCPTAVIDFDLAGPGPRLWDVAYAAYWMTPLSFHAADMVAYAQADIADGSRRLKLFCAGYGIPADRALIETVLRVLRHMADEGAARSMLGEAVSDRLNSDGHFAHWKQEADAFRSRLPELRRNLT